MIALLFPPACISCGRVLETDGYFCEECECDVDRLEKSASNFSPFSHQGSIARAIHRFKYEDHPELARPLAALLVSESEAFITEKSPDWVCAVPLHPIRFRERRFDQAQLLAREVARRVQLPLVAEALVRTRNTARQVDLDQEGREENVAGAFKSGSTAALRGCALLVDDVFTTGATTRACVLVLQNAGVESVGVLTIAQAVRLSASVIS